MPEYKTFFWSLFLFSRFESEFGLTAENLLSFLEAFPQVTQHWKILGIWHLASFVSFWIVQFQLILLSLSWKGLEAD